MGANICENIEYITSDGSECKIAFHRNYGADVHSIIKHVCHGTHIEFIQEIDNFVMDFSLKEFEESDKNKILKSLMNPSKWIHSVRVIERAWLEYEYRPGNVGFRRCLKEWSRLNSD